MTKAKQQEAVMAVVESLNAQGKTEGAAILHLAYEFFENDDFRAKFKDYMWAQEQQRA